MYTYIPTPKSCNIYIFQLDPSEEGSCNYYCHTHFEDSGRKGCEYAIAVSAGHMASTPPRYSSVQELHLLLHLPRENHGKHGKLFHSVSIIIVNGRAFVLYRKCYSVLYPLLHGTISSKRNSCST